MSQRGFFQHATTSERHIWNYLSSFGIMFVILSFLQETLSTESAMFNFAGGASKGIMAVVSGLVLFLCLPFRMDTAKRVVKQDAHII